MEKQLIKRELSSIQATQEEMDSFRQKLQFRLGERGSFLNRVVQKTGFLFQKRLLWLGVPIAAIFLFVTLIPSSRVRFLQESPDEIHKLIIATEHEGNLKEQAQYVMQKGNEQERLNAALVYCLLTPSDQAQYLAIDNLEKEKRPEFRAIYLEYLLDFTEKIPLSLSKIEQLCDTETDPHCMRLFRVMLKYG